MMSLSSSSSSFPPKLLLLLLLLIVGVKGQEKVGCFPSEAVLDGGGGLVDMGSRIFNSYGGCAGECRSIDQYVFGLTNGTNCLCGDRLPPMTSRVEEGEGTCDVACPGYAMDICGGVGFVTVGFIEPPVVVVMAAPESSSPIPGTSAAAAAQVTSTTGPEETPPTVVVSLENVADGGVGQKVI